MEDVHRPGRAAFARYRDDRVSRPKLHSHLQLRRQPKRVDSWRCFIHTFVGVDANDCGCIRPIRVHWVVRVELSFNSGPSCSHERAKINEGCSGCCNIRCHVLYTKIKQGCFFSGRGSANRNDFRKRVTETMYNGRNSKELQHCIRIGVGAKVRTVLVHEMVE